MPNISTDRRRGVGLTFPSTAIGGFHRLSSIQKGRWTATTRSFLFLRVCLDGDACGDMTNDPMSPTSSVVSASLLDKFLVDPYRCTGLGQGGNHGVEVLDAHTKLEVDAEAFDVVPEVLCNVDVWSKCVVI